MEFIVRDGHASVSLSCPGPGGKGTLTLVLQAKNRRVKIPDVTAAVFAGAITELVDSGALIVPGEPPAPDASAESAPAVEAPRPSRRSRRNQESPEE